MHSYELRSSPSTIGGSVNLTPNALRLMPSLKVFPHGCPVVAAVEIFSVHTGAKLGELPFMKSGGALRVMREELQRALLEAVGKKGVEVVFGCKFVGAEHDGEEVLVRFANGIEVRGEAVLGCDGMHSAVRTAFVEPERVPIYTGVSVAYSSFPSEGLVTHFKSTALNTGRFGSLMTTFVDPEREVVVASAVMEIENQEDREGWRLKGRIMSEIGRRFEGSKIEGLEEMVGRMKEPVFFPVYKLGRGEGGMPPQGESAGLAIEDAVLLTRIFASFPSTSSSTSTEVERIFQIYENTRRARIDAAYEEALSRWENVRDKSWFMQKLMEFFTWAWLWWKRGELEANFAYDVRGVELVL